MALMVFKEDTAHSHNRCGLQGDDGCGVRANNGGRGRAPAAGDDRRGDP
jgi:hypothetical protein